MEWSKRQDAREEEIPVLIEDLKFLAKKCSKTMPTRSTQYFFVAATAARFIHPLRLLSCSTSHRWTTTHRSRSPTNIHRCSLSLSSNVQDAISTDDFDGDIELFNVPTTQAATRLDRLLVSQYPDQSRAYFQELISAGAVLVNGGTTRKSAQVRGGECVEIKFITPDSETELQGEDIPLDILYEDEYIVAINKPPGMVVHPAPGNWTGTMLNALAFRFNEMLDMEGKRPGIVHRLDKGTSGVILAAKKAEAQRGLVKDFSERLVQKQYVAICVGNPAGKGCAAGVIDEPIGRSPRDPLRMIILRPEEGGRRARSIVEGVASDDRGLLYVVKVTIETGRTHQIRVHTKHRRAPILGDELYGLHDVNHRFRTSANRPMLHAHRLQFKHPITGDNVDISAPLPEDMRTLIQRRIYPNFEDVEPRW